MPTNSTHPKEFPFNMGADPEFNIIMQSKRISAKHLIKKMFKDKEDSEMGKKLSGGSLGWDGNEATAEIRPDPSKSPIKLAKNLGKMFKEFAKQTQLFKLTTLSNTAPVGGHIHIEIPQEGISQKIMDKRHKIMASFYIPLFIGEDNINLRIRNKNGYGKITDHKEQGVGNGNTVTYEFRVPSAEWMTTERIAIATLAYLGTVWNEIINHPSNIKKAESILIKNNKQAEALHELSISNFVFLTQTMISKIKKHIKTFEYYPEYKKEIEFILNPAKVSAEKRKFDYDIISGWKLQKQITFNKREYLSEKTIKNAGKHINLDDYSQAVNVPYNDDEFVGDFVSKLKHRILVFNWKMKKQIFVFGLKQGVKEYIAIDKNWNIIKGKKVIKTHEDKDIITSIFQRMSERFFIDNAGHTEPERRAGKNFILIGIPYEQRLERNYKPFLELVYNIEKNRIPITAISSLNLSDEQDGPIFKAYNSNESSSIVTCGAEEHQESIVREIIRENQEERIL